LKPWALGAFNREVDAENALMEGGTDDRDG
jgi:hypothetical protein